MRFGYSLPAGVSELPGEWEPEEYRFRCNKCGKFVSEKTMVIEIIEYDRGYDEIYYCDEKCKGDDNDE